MESAQAQPASAAAASTAQEHHRNHQSPPLVKKPSLEPLQKDPAQSEHATTRTTQRRRRTRSDRGSSGLTASPLGIALVAAWLLTVFLAFSFDVVVDVFQRQLMLREPPVVPWALLVCSNAGVHLSLMFMMLLLGRLTKRRFRFFQPFVGGDAFVVLQLAGYAAVYVTAVVRAVLLSQRQERYGAYAVLGVFAVLGHVLLLWSLSFFQPPPSALSATNTAGPQQGTGQAARHKRTDPLSDSMARGWRERLAGSPQREIAWIILCGAMVVLSSTVAEYHPSYRVVNVVVIICFVVASLVTVQKVVVPQWLAHHYYHVLFPVVLQSPAMYILQVFGNGLLLMTFYAELVLFNAQQNAPRSWHLGCGLMAVLAIGAHLVLVHQLHAWVVVGDDVAVQQQAERSANEEEHGQRAPSPQVVLGDKDDGGAASRERPASAEYPKDTGAYGPLLPSLFSVLLCVVLMGILYVSATSGSQLSAYVRQGLVQTQALLVVLLFVQPLITHLMGVFLYGKDYRIWQPFEGTPDFILLQCVGWCCYGVAIFFATLHLSEHRHDNFLLFLMACAVLSQFFIHMSVVRFGRGGPMVLPQPSLTAPAAAADDAGRAGPDAPRATAPPAGNDGPLTTDRTASRSPARSDAVSEDTASTQRTPQWERGARDEAAPTDEAPALNDEGSRGGVLPSLSYATSFGESTQPSCGSLGGPSPFASGVFPADSSSSSALLSSVLNGELLLSMVIVAVSLVLRVVVIAAAYIQVLNSELEEANATRSALGSVLSSTSAAQFPVAAIVVAATIFSMAATPIVQWSMRRHVQLSRPQSHVYVALATLGWGTYSLLFSRFAVLWGLLGVERVSTTSPITRVGLSCFLPSSEFSAWLRQSCDAVAADAQSHYTAAGAVTLATAFEGAVEGFVWCFPYLCLLAGNLFETHAFLREAQTQERVRRAVVSVQHLFHEHHPAQEPSTSTAHGHLPDARLSQLLHTIAGARMGATDADAAAATSAEGSSRNGSIAGGGADSADLKAVHDAARYMTFTLCAATSAAFCSAAFLANAQPIMTLGFGAVGTLTLGMSCLALHYVYGTRVHSGTRVIDAAGFAVRTPVYTFFMPFIGGAKFVVLQSVGWISYTSVLSLMIACALEGRGTAALFVIMAVLSIVAQVALLRSVGYFDASKGVQRGFLQRNAEGFLAAISVVATVSFCRLYDMAEQGRATAHVFSSMVPVVVCSVAVCLAVPLGLMSLQRQSELYGLGPLAAWFAGDDDDAEEEGREETADGETSAEDINTGSGGSPRLHSRGASTWQDTVASPLSDSVASPGMPHSIYSRANTEGSFSPLLGTPSVVRRQTFSMLQKRGGNSSTRRRSHAAVILYLLSTLLAMLVIVVLPFAVIFMGYVYYTQRATVTFGLAIRAVEALLCCFTALVVLPMLVVPVLGRSSILRNVHSAFCCWALYNIPTYTFLGGISTSFLYTCRGTYLFTINMCSMALLSNLPYMPVAMSIFSICSFVYFIKYHFYDGVYVGKHALEPVQCVVDLAIAVFWLWYQRRYHGRPEVTGRLQSNRATRFFQRYFFRGLVYYFSMRVFVGEPTVLPQEEPYVADVHAVPRVDLSKPENQYMFSFHPHGVFPGTSMVAPKTEIWEKAVGSCKEHFVSTHCADIVFNVPLMREFPMCLGAMSVGRRGIESSLRQGNSPLIVTGGQAEMLLTRMTDYEMHVVCHHTGFIRMAIKNRVPLVPVISYSESNILDNVHCIRLQRWFLKRIAFPFPTLPIGRWYLPLPTTKPVTIVVGQPISPLPGRDNPEDPAHIEELRFRYFEHLEVLFYKSRAEAGYPEMELYLHNGIYNPGVRGTAAVATPLTKDKADAASAAMFSSAVRRAFSMAPDAKTEAAPKEKTAAKES